MEAERICPYCGVEMEKGILTAGARMLPFWCEEGRKRSVGEALCRRGVIPSEKEGRIVSYYCSDCEKIIIDAKLELFN